jgi:hypothetical protein
MASFLSHPSDREAAKLKPASQQPHELFKQHLAAIGRQPADAGQSPAYAFLV